MNVIDTAPARDNEALENLIASTERDMRDAKRADWLRAPHVIGFGSGQPVVGSCDTVARKLAKMIVDSDVDALIRAEEIYLQIDARIENNFGREAAFLSELVKVASDNPPGDCAPHAARTRQLLESLGFAVEVPPVPKETVHAAGMKSQMARPRASLDLNTGWVPGQQFSQASVEPEDHDLVCSQIADVRKPCDVPAVLRGG